MGTPTVLARLRLRKGLTQRELAALADLTIETISRVENGKRPGNFTIAKLAAALDMEFDDLWREFDIEADEVSA